MDAFKIHFLGNLRKGLARRKDLILGTLHLFFVDKGNERLPRLSLKFAAKGCAIGFEQKSKLVNGHALQIVLAHVCHDLMNEGGSLRLFLRAIRRAVFSEEKQKKALERHPYVKVLRIQDRHSPKPQGAYLLVYQTKMQIIKIQC